MSAVTQTVLADLGDQYADLGAAYVDGGNEIGRLAGHDYRGLGGASLGMPALGFFRAAPEAGGNAADWTGFEVRTGAGAVAVPFDIPDGGTVVAAIGFGGLAKSDMGLFTEAGITAIAAEWRTECLAVAACFPLGLIAIRWAAALAATFAAGLEGAFTGP